jgi:Uma2 family endonuclease
MVGSPVIDGPIISGRQDTRPMTVDEFYAFTDTRPDREKWELIGGEPVLNAAPSRLHQLIVRNVIVALGIREREIKASWRVIPGPGVRISDEDRPEPDVLVTPADQILLDPQACDIENVIVAFEVLSPSTRRRDLGWKRDAYTSLPSLTHYIVILPDAVDVTVFARDNKFAKQRIKSLGKEIDLRSLGVSLPVAEIYRDTGLTA